MTKQTMKVAGRGELLWLTVPKNASHHSKRHGSRKVRRLGTRCLQPGHRKMNAGAQLAFPFPFPLTFSLGPMPHLRQVFPTQLKRSGNTPETDSGRLLGDFKCRQADDED